MLIPLTQLHPSTRRLGADFHRSPSPPAAAAGAALLFAPCQQCSDSFHVKAVMQKARGYFLQTAPKFTGCRGSRGPRNIFCLVCQSQVSCCCCQSSDLCRGFCPSGSCLARILLFTFSGQHKILLKFLLPPLLLLSQSSEG